MRILSTIAMMSGLIGVRSMSVLPKSSVSASPGPGQGKRSRPSYTTLHKPHGQRERDRRIRQIASGRLRAENGLVASA